MTLRLYYEDAYCTEFDARIVRAVRGKTGANGVVLDRTCFYPTSGGQPNDLGSLDSHPVLDVADEASQIIHWITGDLQGPTVHGRINWARRFDHMQQHTGQHILSQAFLKSLNAQTVSFHLGEELSTIDIDRPSLDAAQVEQVEELANQIVFADRPVLTSWVQPGELSTVELRKAPSVQKDIRIVEVEGFDRSPCGGTHCSRSGAVGAIAIRKWERRAPEVRVEFLCGWRAVRDYRWKTAAIRELALAFTVKDRELPTAVLRLVQEATDNRREADRLRDELLEAEAANLLGEATSWNGTRVVVRAFDEREPQQVRKLASLLTSGHRAIALLGISGKDGRLVFACSEDSAADMAELMKQTCLAFGGKGGGQRRLAQGGGFSGRVVTKALDFAFQMLSAKPRT
jgi:alanyl-tRNA synthetase